MSITVQIEEMVYCAVKKVKRHNVEKSGNLITITYDTELDKNQKNLKKAQLVLNFVDGVSDDMAANDIFTNVCRYIKK